MDPQSAAAAERVMRRCQQLAQCSEVATQITRTFCSPAMQAAHGLVRGWMDLAGMKCRLDPATNLIGRYSSPLARAGTTSVVLMGSHLDSVKGAGKYDGTLGVLMGIALVEMLRESTVELPFALDVVAFCEEEGVRYQTPYIGSRALIGDLTEDVLQRCDAAGISMAEAIRGFGGDPDNLHEAIYPERDVIAYLESHIEQGPILELRDLPVGVVTGIAGQSRAAVEFVGRAGHAGTMPMSARRDALAAAAEMVIEVERIARSRSDLVATVGCLNVTPNVANVIPARASLRFEVRSLDDQARKSGFEQIIDHAQAIADRRGVAFEVSRSEDSPTTHCNAQLIEMACAAVLDAGVEPFQLPSGAGHDAVALAKNFPVAMLFVRCPGGISHHPLEAVAEGDVAIALDVSRRLILRLADRHRHIVGASKGG
jgi:allantoate deiminase